MEETTADSNSQNKLLPNGKSIESSDCDEESAKESVHSRNTSSQNVRICITGSLRLDNDVVLAAQSFDAIVVMSEDGAEWELSTAGTTVFVVEDFSGPVFDKLHELGHRILGPVALRELVEIGKELPRNTRPLYTLAMWGLVICFTGFHKKDELEEVLSETDVDSDLDFGEIVGFVTCIYNNKWWLGCGLGVEEKKVKISFLEPHGPFQSLKYIQSPDVLHVTQAEV